jgi:hypothetical protein
METFVPAMLQRKSALELFQMRQRVVNELRAMHDGAEGRDLAADEKALEERGEKNLKAIDEALEGNLRNQAFDRYSGIGRQHLSERDMAAVDWLKSAITEKNPAAFTLEPRAPAFSRNAPDVRFG